MRNVLFALLSVGVVWFASPVVAQEAKQDFTLVNKTGYELKAVYVGPSTSEDWGDDIMGQDVLADGHGVNIHFQPKVKACKWDLKVVYTEDDSKAVWSGIDLCNVSKITIYYDKDNDKTRATFD